MTDVGFSANTTAVLSNEEKLGSGTLLKPVVHLESPLISTFVIEKEKGQEWRKHGIRFWSVSILPGVIKISTR